MISQEQFVESDGNCCPHCYSEKIKHSELKKTIGYIFQENECEKCNLQFKTVFTLVGYEVEKI